MTVQVEIESILGVFAHPDDESLAAGGVLARAASLGERTSVVTTTWTEGTLRAQELTNALSHLNAGRPRFLGYADAGIAHSAPNAPRLLDGVLDEQVGRLVTVIREFQPHTVITHDIYGGLAGHPDHVRTNRITTLAVEAAGLDLAYPMSGRPWQTPLLMFATHPASTLPMVSEMFGTDRARFVSPDYVVTDSIDVGPWLETKVAAILAHASEVERGAAPGIIGALSPADRRRVLSTEWFIRRATFSGHP